MRSFNAVCRLSIACLLGVLAVACRMAPDASTRVPPRLILLIAVDQLIPERLDPALPGGLGRIAREGRVFTDAAHAHARTETCPGHAVMLTGVHPGRAGIPGNRFIVTPPSGEGPPRVRYCVQDDGPDGVLLTADEAAARDAAVAAGTGRSPKQLRVSALGDWMKASWPESRVFAVSAKDRAAIVMGGQRSDAAYWLDRKGSGAFTTSRHYLAALPPWVRAWTRDRVLAGLPETWDYGATRFAAEIRGDDYAYESDRFSRTAPHPLVAHDDRAPSPPSVEASPYLDERTLAFAEDLVAHEGLGEDDVPDLLAVSLSATDIVGHFYGPGSREAWASLVALDDDLAGFIARLELRVGPGRLLVALTSDHGVLPIPEWWQTHGGAEAACPVEGGRVSPSAIDTVLSEALSAAFGDDWTDAWVRDGLTVGFDRTRAQRDGVHLEAIIAAVKPGLQAVAGVDRVWSRRDLEGALQDDAFATLYINQLAPGRGGDVFLQPARGCLFTTWPSGTSHGSPHDYDRAVPLAFWGSGVEAGRVSGSSAPVDLAPTLAGWIGLPVPAGLDGRALLLQRQP